MAQRYLIPVLAAFVSFGPVALVRGQAIELSGMGSVGIADGEDIDRNLATAGGASFGWGTKGARKPFFQFGADIMRESRKDVLDAPSGAKNSLAVLLGAGVTLDITPHLFLRPELRSYWYVGPTIALLPAVSLGLKF